MKIKISTLVIVAACVLSAVYITGRVSAHPKIKRLSTALETLNDKIAYKDIVIDGLSQTVAQKDALVLTYREALDAEIISKEEMRRLHLRELNSKTTLITQLKTTLDSIKHTGVIVYDTLYVKDTLAVVPSIRLPFDFEKKTKYTTLTGGFNLQGVMSAKVETSVPLDVYVGIQKGSHDATVMVKSENPDLKTVYISSLVVEAPPKRWYERQIIGDVLKVGAGILIGRATK